MKKILLLLLVSTLSLVSCTNEEPMLIGSQSENLNEEISFKNDSTIILLTNFNDSLLSITHDVESKGKFWDIFKKACKVAFADVNGAFKGFKWGARFGSTVGWISATIVGIGSSAVAGIQEFSTSASSVFVSQSDVEAAYAITVCDPNFENNKSLVGENVKISIPDEFAPSIEMGKVHNLTLEVLQQGNLIVENVDGAFTAEEIEALHSDGFQAYYIKCLKNNDAYDLDSPISDEDSKEVYVTKLFIDLYKKYPNDIDDVNYIINEYSRIIENDTELTFEDKQIIYTALTMAGFSTDYWEQNIKRGFPFENE